MNPRIEKYLRVVEWARARYTDRRTHLLVLDTAGVKSTYSRIEDAAFAKYMALSRDASGALISAEREQALMEREIAGAH